MARRTKTMSRGGALVVLALGGLEAATACGRSHSGRDDDGPAARSGGMAGSGDKDGSSGQGSGGHAGESPMALGGSPPHGGGTSGRGGSMTAGGEAGEAGRDSTSSGGSAIAITGGSAGQSCADFQTTLKPSRTALYLVLDISGSMLDPSGLGTTTKWQAMKEGVTTFLDQSRDLDVAVGYFPHRLAGVPETCATDDDCGPGAPCLTNVCEQAPGTIVACTPTVDAADLEPCNEPVLRDDGPCGAGACQVTGAACASDEDCRVRGASLGRCFMLGVCDGDPTLTCSVADPSKPHPGCGPNGTVGKCIPEAAHYCLHETDCNPDGYENPALDFPAALSDVQTSLDAQVPRGDSPARAALRGAIAHARASRTASGRDVAVVLATDGLPSDCSTARAASNESSTALDDLVAEAREGFDPSLTPEAASVRTFVLGVLGDTDSAAADGLARVAQAGGTEHAYLLAADDDAARHLATGLRAIEDASLGCRLDVPPGVPGDTALVTVVLESGGDAETLERVAPDGCSDSGKQWRFEADANGSITGLELCPATCTFLKSTPDAEVEVLFGCRPGMR